jgi:hypothetical protein
MCSTIMDPTAGTFAESTVEPIDMLTIHITMEDILIPTPMGDIIDPIPMEDIIVRTNFRALSWRSYRRILVTEGVRRQRLELAI